MIISQFFVLPCSFPKSGHGNLLNVRETLKNGKKTERFFDPKSFWSVFCTNNRFHTFTKLVWERIVCAVFLYFPFPFFWLCSYLNWKKNAIFDRKHKAQSEQNRVEIKLVIIKITGINKICEIPKPKNCYKISGTE